MERAEIVKASSKSIVDDPKLLKAFLENPDRVAAETSGLTVDSEFVQAVIDHVKLLLETSEPSELDDAQLDRVSAAGFSLSTYLSKLKPRGHYSLGTTAHITSVR